MAENGAASPPPHPHPLRIGLGLGPRAFWNGKKNKKWYDDVNARVILSNNVCSVWHNRQDLPVQMPQPHMAPTPALKYLQLPAGESSKELSLAQDTPREKVGGRLNFGPLPDAKRERGVYSRLAHTQFCGGINYQSMVRNLFRKQIVVRRKSVCVRKESDGATIVVK